MSINEKLIGLAQRAYWKHVKHEPMHHALEAYEAAKALERIDKLKTLLRAVLQVLDDMDCISDYDDRTDEPLWVVTDGVRGTTCCPQARDELESAYRAIQNEIKTNQPGDRE